MRRKLWITAGLMISILLFGTIAHLIPAYGADAAGEAGKTYEWTFDKDTHGKDAKGFEAFAGVWKVATDESAPSGPNVLAQTAKLSRREFPGCVVQGNSFKDFEASVKFKPISGKIDASGGIIFRFVNQKSYYVVRANSLEDNFRLYYYVKGKRKRIASTKVKPPELGKWHSIKVVCKGDEIKCYLNGKLLITHRDSTYKEGKVGLWTKADAVTNFDDLVVVVKEGDQATRTKRGTEKPIVLNFEEVALGKLPPGWLVEATNQRGPLATWKVIEDRSAPSKARALALTQPNHNFGGTFNICWTDKVSFGDGEIEVRFKAVGGQEDQGGGPIWRVRDKDNYYIARANPLEHNFRIYYVKDGARKTLDSVNVKAPSGKWHTIKIVHHADHIEGYFNGKKLLEARDSTFRASGGIGLWTKADAVTSFDDLTLRRSAAQASAELARIKQAIADETAAQSSLLRAMFQTSKISFAEAAQIVESCYDTCSLNAYVASLR